VIARLVYDVFFQSRIADKKTLILGTGAMARSILKIIKETPHSGLSLAGVVSEEAVAAQKDLDGVPMVGSSPQLLSLIDWHHIQLVVLAIDSPSKISEPELMMALMRQNVQVTSAVHLFEKMDEAIPFDAVNEHFILGLMSEARGLRYLHTKRILDLVIVSLFNLFFAANVGSYCFFTGSRYSFSRSNRWREKISVD
jgi:FlaA1/EpsC-like NDP-sugar epimerase